MDNIAYMPMQEQDLQDVFKLAAKLWSDYEPEELLSSLKSIFFSAHQKIYLAKHGKAGLVAFAHFSIRQDYVEGASRSPTGYLEGIYVEPDVRHQGIAKHLLGIGETWLLENDCHEIGSDTWLQNTVSQNFHHRLGFEQEEILVHFLKKIK